MPNDMSRLKHAKEVGLKEKKVLKQTAKSNGCGNAHCSKGIDSSVVVKFCSGCRKVGYCSRGIADQSSLMSLDNCLVNWN